MDAELAGAGREDEPLGRIVTGGPGAGACVAPLALGDEGHCSTSSEEGPRGGGVIGVDEHAER